jgi:hypothetical protein
MFDVRNEGCGLKHLESRFEIGLAFLVQEMVPAC